MRFLTHLSAILQPMLDLIWPPVCSSCQKALPDADLGLCAACASNAQLLCTATCAKCGTPLVNAYCEACAHTEFNFELSRNAFVYKEPLTSLIHNLKYRGFTRSTQYLAAGMATVIRNNPEYSACDYICAVPLHSARKRERGYNQSELIAKDLAKICGIPYINSLKRRRYTKSQTRLQRSERLQNLQGAFKAVNSKKIQGKRLILVDDVFTTGSTLNESSKALHAAGVELVYGLTAARA